MALGVLATGSPAAEPACGERRSLADPAVHSRSPNGPTEAGTDIMARSRPEITHGFAGRRHERGEVRATHDPDRKRPLRRHRRGPRDTEDQRELAERVPRTERPDVPAVRKVDIGLALPDEVVAASALAGLDD